MEVVANLKSTDPEAIFAPFNEVPSSSVTTTKTKTIQTSYNAPPTYFDDYELIAEGKIWNTDEDGKSETKSTAKFSPLYSNERNPIGSPDHNYYSKNVKTTNGFLKDSGCGRQNNFPSTNNFPTANNFPPSNIFTSSKGTVDWNTPGSHLLNLLPNHPKVNSPKKEGKLKSAARMIPGTEKKFSTPDEIEDSEMEDVSEYFSDARNGSKEKMKSTVDDENKNLVKEVASLKQLISDLVSSQKQTNSDVQMLAKSFKNNISDSTNTRKEVTEDLKKYIDDSLLIQTSVLNQRFSLIEKDISSLTNKDVSASPKSEKKNE
jgi:hypothetical protein